MAPELLQRLEQVERTVLNLQTVTDLSFIEELKRRLGGISVTVEAGASTAGTTVAVRNVTDNGSETVAEEYTSVATLSANGTVIGRIGIY